MTISSQSRQAGPYLGNDVATGFAFAFKVFSATDLQVVHTDAAGAESTLTLTTDYTVTLNSNQDSNPGGTVTLLTALATSTKLTITSSIDALQATDLTNQGGFYPKVITNALDKLTILIQQILNALGRSLKFPISDSGYNPTLPGKDNRRGRVLAFHETSGDPVQGPLITSLDTVTANVAAVDTVAGSIDDVNTVAGSISNVNAVAGNEANVNTVGASIDSVNSTGGSIANVNTVAGSISNVNAVAGNEANVNAVAGSISNVNAVGSSIADVNSAAANMSAIIAAPSQAAAATAARIAAEAARDAAQLSAGVYADTTAGLAATTSGQYFSVPSSVTNEYLILYLNSSGSAVAIKTYPSAALVSALDNRLVTVEGGLAKYIGTADLVPLITDTNGAVLLGVYRSTGAIFVATLESDSVNAILGGYGIAEFIGAGPVYPLVTDAQMRVVLGVNKDTGLLVGSGLATSTASESQAKTALSSAIVSKANNHLLFYGQSLSVGANAGSVLSTTQPYSNITFHGGPRAWDGATWDFGAFKPLVEDAVSPAPDGGTNRAETSCSGAANYASTLMALGGVNPSSHVILASTAGHGGYTISQLNKGTPWYANLLAHASGAHALNSNHAVHALCWVQGENDVIAPTNYATYRAALAQLQADSETDIKTITGQTSPVYLLSYQCSYGATVNTGVALAQLDLAQKSDRIFLTTPTYFFPFAGDNVHMTALGYKWMGAYFGRAYKALVDGFEPQWLNPRSATLRAAELRVRFDVPYGPLVLDTTELAVTTDMGFKVLDGVTPATINSIAIDGSDVVLNLAVVPSGSVTVRYALDYLGAGLTLTNGASGNLRDSATDTISISGVDKPLWNVCPAFELTAIKLGE